VQVVEDVAESVPYEVEVPPVLVAELVVCV
jgi:hypothetical protein